MGRAVVFKIKNFEFFGHKFLETLQILYWSIWRPEKVVPIMLKKQLKASSPDLKLILTLSLWAGQ